MTNDEKWNRRYNELLACLREDNPGTEFPEDIEEIRKETADDTAENKRILLEMARKGEPRPDPNSKLGKALAAYTTKPDSKA